MTKQARGRAIAGELFVATVAVTLYARTLGYELVFDDLSLIGDDGPQFLGGRVIPYRPLRYASYWLDHLIGGGQAWAYHASNIALHAACAVLVVRLARRLGALDVAAVLAGLAFSVHPLAVEVAAYVSGRRDLLALFFGSAALLAWLHPSRSRTVPAVVCVIAAVAAKEAAALYVGAFAVASMCALGPVRRTSVGILVPVVAATIALPIAYGATGPIVVAASAGEALAVTGELAAHYARNLWFPVALAADYPQLHSAGSRGLAGASALSGLAVVFVSLAALVAAVRTGLVDGEPSPVTFASAWLALFVLAVCAVIGLHEPGADRHAYPVLAAACVAVAVSASRLARNGWRRGAAMLALGLVAGFAMLSHRSIPVWRNQWTLWSSTVVAAPRSARAHHNLASLLAGAGAHRHARSHLSSALDAEPAYVPVHLALARMSCAQGRIGRARKHLRDAAAHGAAAGELATVERSCSRGGGR